MRSVACTGTSGDARLSRPSALHRAAATMPSGIEFRVHPLVLLNMSDHYTRYGRTRGRGRTHRRANLRVLSALRASLPRAPRR